MVGDYAPPYNPEMPVYTRAFRPGGTFFLTLVTERRQPLFATAPALALLHEAFDRCRTHHPFDIDAMGGGSSCPITCTCSWPCRMATPTFQSVSRTSKPTSPAHGSRLAATNKAAHPPASASAPAPSGSNDSGNAPSATPPTFSATAITSITTPSNTNRPHARTRGGQRRSIDS
jgi:hypothetical protein